MLPWGVTLGTNILNTQMFARILTQYSEFVCVQKYSLLRGLVRCRSIMGQNLAFFRTYFTDLLVVTIY